jgi:hypothetical protein
MSGNPPFEFCDSMDMTEETKTVWETEGKRRRIEKEQQYRGGILIGGE